MRVWESIKYERGRATSSPEVVNMVLQACPSLSLPPPLAGSLSPSQFPNPFPLLLLRHTVGRFFFLPGSRMHSWDTLFSQLRESEEEVFLPLISDAQRYPNAGQRTPEHSGVPPVPSSGEPFSDVTTHLYQYSQKGSAPAPAVSSTQTPSCISPQGLPGKEAEEKGEREKDKRMLGASCPVRAVRASRPPATVSPWILRTQPRAIWDPLAKA